VRHGSDEVLVGFLAGGHNFIDPEITEDEGGPGGLGVGYRSAGIVAGGGNRSTGFLPSVDSQQQLAAQCPFTIGAHRRPLRVQKKAAASRPQGTGGREPRIEA